MKIDQKTADAILRLAHSPEFQTFCEWLEELNTVLTNNAIAGISNDPANTPDVLRGRAQTMAIIKQEMENAPKVSARIQKVS